MTLEKTDSPGAGVVLAHPSGNQFFRHLAVALRDAARLAQTFTCVDWPAGGWLDRMLPRSVAAELGRRSFSRDLGIPVAQHPWREAGRLAAGRLGWRSLARHETGLVSVDAVYRDFDRWVARRLGGMAGAGIAYAYEDAAEATFVEAEKLGWLRAYDLPIAYWETSRRLLEEEAERWPAWEQTLGGTRDSERKCQRKRGELAAANVVVCPSDFVVDSLPTWAHDGKRIVVARFGSPATGVVGADLRRPNTGKLRVLFAGSMSQRKGLADVFAAMRLLRRHDVELVVMGALAAPMDFYRREFAGFTHERPRPHAEVLRLMRSCDILVLPSIVEGRALVMQEAMSQGLPIMVTPNTGGGDLVDENSTGFLLPIRAPEAIATRIEWCAENRDALPEMGRAAEKKARAITWRDYARKVIDAIDNRTDCSINQPRHDHRTTSC